MMPHIMLCVAFVLFAADLAFFVSCGAFCDAVSAQQGAVGYEGFIYAALVLLLLWRLRVLYVFATGPAILTAISFAESCPLETVAAYNALGSCSLTAGAASGVLPAVVSQPAFAAFAASLLVVSLGNAAAVRCLAPRVPRTRARGAFPTMREARAMRPPRVVGPAKPRRRPPPVPSSPSPGLGIPQEIMPGVFVSPLLDTSEDEEEE